MVTTVVLDVHLGLLSGLASRMNSLDYLLMVAWNYDFLLLLDAEWLCLLRLRLQFYLNFVPNPLLQFFAPTPHLVRKGLALVSILIRDSLLRRVVLICLVGLKL